MTWRYWIRVFYINLLTEGLSWCYFLTVQHVGEAWSSSNKTSLLYLPCNLVILGNYCSVCSMISPRRSWQSETPTACTSLGSPWNLSQSYKTNIMYPHQLWGQGFQMLLPQWRYVNQCNLEITPPVTWVQSLGSGLTYKHRQIADYPQDLQSSAVLSK